MRDKKGRVILLVLDSVGVGNAEDAELFGDQGSNTVGNIHRWHLENGLEFSLPNLCRLGLDNILPNTFSDSLDETFAYSARFHEISAGKDTTSGHWELMGAPLKEAFSHYPNGFPTALLEEWCQLSEIPGFLGNKSASGTDIIAELGEEHVSSLKPIVYTSSDSVLQIAAHEEAFGLEKLYRICEKARELTREQRIGRVIARPFLGNSPSTFSRTNNRKDYSLVPPKNILDILVKNEINTVGVGKISDIFNGRSLNESYKTNSNHEGVDRVLEILKRNSSRSEFVFANLIDFDQHFGHRRDPKGYGQCLVEFDQRVPELLNALKENDWLIITADHGNDPTFKGSDHTRECVPFMVTRSSLENGQHLGDFRGFHHCAKLILDLFELNESLDSLTELCPLIKDLP